MPYIMSRKIWPACTSGWGYQCDVLCVNHGCAVFRTLSGASWDASPLPAVGMVLDFCDSHI